VKTRHGESDGGGAATKTRERIENGELRMEKGKEAFLPNEMIHNYYYQLGQHCDSGTATTAFSAL
jgi:hypothetical protein